MNDSRNQQITTLKKMLMNLGVTDLVSLEKIVR